MTNEKELIRRVLDGDHTAFAEIVSLHEDKVFRLCLRMTGNREDAEDLAQEAFVKAWRGLRFYKQEAAFSTWLYRLTSNVCIDFLRQKKRRVAQSLTLQDEEQTLIEIPDPAPAPDEQAQTQEVRHCIAAAMGQLEEESRLVLMLRVVDELSYDEIAQITDLKVGTVKSRLARAREKLRKILLQTGNDFFGHNVKESREEDVL